ncbi:hypothetical protein DPMN_169770 [Dreissena polymorpha]|uniref:Uncharacterized protein n=1 Tax=Dreissena polymorpha TaxID=45954 RepID=A0A9D4DY08_DREPO|nr:hypothetical protein DPMN_169770 [Dreissena polymorpha]
MVAVVMVTLAVRIPAAMAKTVDLSNSLHADSHDLSDELNAGVITGIVIGSLAEIGLMAAMVIIAAKHKMKKTKVGRGNHVPDEANVMDEISASSDDFTANGDVTSVEPKTNKDKHVECQLLLPTEHELYVSGRGIINTNCMGIARRQEFEYHKTD